MPIAKARWRSSSLSGVRRPCIWPHGEGKVLGSGQTGHRYHLVCIALPLGLMHVEEGAFRLVFMPINLGAGLAGGSTDQLPRLQGVAPSPQPGLLR